MAVRFNLNRRPSSDGLLSLRLCVRRGESEVKIGTGIRIKESEWAHKTQRMRSSVAGSAEFNDALHKLKNETEALAILHPSDADLKRALLQRLGKGEKKAEPTILELYTQFLEQKKARQKPATTQIYKALQDHLKGFLESDKAKPASITAGWLEDFQTYLLTKGQQNSTVNKLVTRCKGFLRWIQARGHIDRVPDANRLAEGKNFVLYLTLPELRSLMVLDLADQQPGYAAARDLFVVSGLTGQRFSDLQKMRWEDIRGDVWYLRTQKRNINVRVPLARQVREIIQSRKGEETPLPTLSNVKANVYIKAVAALAGIDTPVTIHTQKGGVQESKTVPKHQALTMHCGKRTFVSLMLEQGMTETELLGLTHDDLKILKLYAGKDENRRNEKLTGIIDAMTG